MARGKVRQYKKSDAPRMRWTEELHRRFVVAVEYLGGETSKFLLFIDRLLKQIESEGSVDYCLCNLSETVICKFEAFLDYKNGRKLNSGLHER